MNKDNFRICGINELPKFIEQYKPTHVISLAREGKATQEAVDIVNLFNFPIIHHVENFDDVDGGDKKYYDNNENPNEFKITFPTEEHVRRITRLVDETFNDDSMVIIHCTAGVSRSTAMTFGVLVYGGIDILEAFKQVTLVRPYHYMNSLVLKHWDKVLNFEKTEGLQYLNKEWNKFGDTRIYTKENVLEMINEFIESKKNNYERK